MAKKYRAVVASFGWRGRHWLEGDIAEDVKPEENIPPHFVPVEDQAPEEPAKPKEPETFSELQKVQEKRVKGPMEVEENKEVDVPKPHKASVAAPRLSGKVNPAHRAKKK